MIDVSAESERERLVVEARLIAQVSPVLFPLLIQRRERAVRRLIGNFRSDMATGTIVAEISVIDDILTELQNKINNVSL